MAAAATQPTATAVAPMTRREFLYYIWAASMALFLAETGGAILWFAVPRFKAGEFGGIFELLVGEVPPPDSNPASFDAGRFWLVNVGQATVERQLSEHPGTAVYNPTPGVKALYKVCVHLGCLYKWVPTNARYECPCHGSKYLPTGARTDGPARRNLDVFVIEAIDDAGQVLAVTQAQMGNEEGSAIVIPPGATRLRVNTGRRIPGAGNSAPGGGQ